MKHLVLLALAASVSADVAHLKPSSSNVVPIVKSEYEISPDGAFHYAFETGDGVFGQAEGALRGADNALSVKGYSRYTAPDGQTYEVNYVADENGYQPQGSHLPVAHPIPDYIQKAIEYIAAHPQKEVPRSG